MALLKGAIHLTSPCPDRAETAEDKAVCCRECCSDVFMQERTNAWNCNLVSLLCCTNYLNSQLTSNTCVSWIKLIWLLQTVFCYHLAFNIIKYAGHHKLIDTRVRSKQHICNNIFKEMSGKLMSCRIFNYVIEAIMRCCVASGICLLVILAGAICSYRNGPATVLWLVPVSLHNPM